MLERSALWQLTWTRTLGFLREPEAMFWVFAFPVLMALALGIAFRNSGPQKSSIAVEQGPQSARISAALATSPDLSVTTLDPEAEPRRAAPRQDRGPGARDVDGTPVLGLRPDATRDPALRASRPHDALERSAGRRDPLAVKSDTAVQVGSRYIDFVVPGLLGLNLLGTGMWGIGFPVVTARQHKRLKRIIATPMRRSHYLISLRCSRGCSWLVLEVVARVRLRPASPSASSSADRGSASPSSPSSVRSRSPLSASLVACRARVPSKASRA